LQDIERVSDVSMMETMKEIIKLSELLKTVYSYYENSSPYEKELIIKKIFSELLLDENGLKYKVKKEFEPFETRFIAPWVLKGWLSELLTYSSYIKDGIKELEPINKDLSTTMPVHNLT